MDPAPESLPDDVAALKAALIAERARRLEVAAELAVAQAKASEDMALIAAQKLRIAKASPNNKRIAVLARPASDGSYRRRRTHRRDDDKGGPQGRMRAR